MGILDLGEITDDKVGNLANLDTEHKNDLVSAINEVLDLTAKASQVGDLADLATDHKSDIVSAINELAGTCGKPSFRYLIRQNGR